jgi:hypothetical protein
MDTFQRTTDSGMEAGPLSNKRASHRGAGYSGLGRSRGRDDLPGDLIVLVKHRGERKPVLGALGVLDAQAARQDTRHLHQDCRVFVGQNLEV